MTLSQSEVRYTTRMNTDQLEATVAGMLADGKGLLAADESTATVAKHFFDPHGVQNTEDNRRAWREMLFTTPSLGEYISGVIMYDETIRQSAGDSRTFVDVLKTAGIIPGIKVDLGTERMADSPEEKLTKGIDGLPTRLKEYFDLGARFAKWRAVITIGEELPTDANLEQNALDLATYAKMCQEAGIVPIVEPEVLMDGTHSMARCEEVSEKSLTMLFNTLREENVFIEGLILKTNMIVPGIESGEKATLESVAEATMRVFKKVLPDTLRGEAFLSGGQSEIEATQNLNAIAKTGPHPWTLTFSYGRALQESAAKAWAGKYENVAAAQKIFLHRAKMNSLATKGSYVGET